MNRKVNIAGQKLSQNSTSRIMREKQAHDRQLEMRKADLVRQEISHKKLEHLKMRGEVDRVRREIAKLKSDHGAPMSQEAIRRAESELRALESQEKMIDQDIRSKSASIENHGNLHF